MSKFYDPREQDIELQEASAILTAVFWLCAAVAGLALGLIAWWRA